MIFMLSKPGDKKKTEGLQYQEVVFRQSRDSCLVTRTDFSLPPGETCRPVFPPPVSGSFQWETSEQMSISTGQEDVSHQTLTLSR